jgi:hypothetical protein
MMVYFFKFIKTNDIEFESKKQALRWIRSLKPNTLVRIGNSYFIKEDEINQLIESYFNQKIALKKKQSIQAKKNFAKKKLSNPLTFETKP